MAHKILYFSALLLVCSSSFAADTIYPVGSNVQCSYLLNTNEILIDDTLTVTRQIINNEDFVLSKIYLSENVPVNLDLVDFDVTLNGVLLSDIPSTFLQSHIRPGYENVTWIIDDPGGFGISHDLNPQDTLNLTYKVVCRELGDYWLPLHTAIFYGNNQAYFATSDSVEVRVVLVLDTNDIDDPLPTQFLISRAYPNPFNSSVRIEFEAFSLRNRQINLTIFDLLGRTVYENNIVAENDKSSIFWNTTSDQATGLYFYRISVNEQETIGKLILLK